MTEHDSEDTNRDDLILKELRLTREILSEHTEALQAIQRELKVVRATQQDQGKEIGTLGARVTALELGGDGSVPKALTPVPKVSPKLDGGEGR
jgi:hypothetical protein